MGGITYADKIAGISKILAADLNEIKDVINNTKFLPVGTIMMFDANNSEGASGNSGAWVDNSTLPGWYACITDNSDKSCPDLVDTFIMGKVAAGAGGSGGSNVLIDHTHTSSNQSTSHTHTTNSTSKNLTGSAGTAEDFGICGYATGIFYIYGGPRNNGTDTGSSNRNYLGIDATHSHGTGNQSASHNHTIGSGEVPASTDSKPAYYSVVYIRKCIL